VNIILFLLHIISKLERSKLMSSQGSSIVKQAFQNELKKTGFTVFAPLKDLGYFSWKPSGVYTELSDIGSAEEITKFLEPEGKPKDIVPLNGIELPKQFPNPVPQTFWHRFPFGQYEAACLHVAAQHRSVDFSGIDFMFGGSTLDMLARKNAADGPFMAMRIPFCQSIMVVRSKKYMQDLSNVGFQFERLVTGEDMAAKAEFEYTDHIHEMMVGPYRVLFQAETDGVYEGELVEVKASNPHWWDTHVMFQMISSGSTKLCHGVKQYGTLHSINLKSLSDVALDAFKSQDRSILETNILSSMTRLKDEMQKSQKNQVFEIKFDDDCLQLLPVTDPTSAHILPPQSIVRELLGTATDDDSKPEAKKQRTDY